MEFVAVLLVAAATFGVCFLIDKGFAKLFRSQAQHKSGLSVRLNKKYGAFGLICFALGVAAIFAGFQDTFALMIGGCVVTALGIGLVVYYMSFGVFYDEESFLIMRLGKKNQVYPYEQIRCQQLYRNYASLIIELQMEDGTVLQLQTGMTNLYPFLDKAFSVWCSKKGLEEGDCAFHDPENSCWFPKEEEL